MWWADQSCAFDDRAGSAVNRLAIVAGIQPELAREVGGAISSYCRARHGTERVDRDYLLYLIERTGFHGDAVDAMTGNRVLMQVLRGASDAAALYEAYRRHFVRPVLSQVCRGGWLVRINLHQVQAGAREDLTLLWLPVFRRIAGWVGEWRSLALAQAPLLVEGRSGDAKAWPERRAYLAALIRQRESEMNIPPAELYWVDEKRHGQKI